MRSGYGLEFSHTPDLFYLPYLLTGDPVMLRRMERIDQYFRQYRHFTPEQAINGQTGRELAWQLRNLFRLAYFQQRGLTEKTHYVASLNATRDRLLKTIQSPNAETEMFRALNWNTVYSGSYGFTSWQQSFIGQVINHGIQMGFADWLPIAQYHFEHLLRRCGDRWPLKACDNDHVFFANYMQGDTDWAAVKAFAKKADWAVVTPYMPSKMPGFVDYPADELLPVNTGYTYANRAQYAYGWAALAAKNGIDGAKALAEKIREAITRRGDRWDYKNAVTY